MHAAKSQEMLTELFAALPEDPYEYLSQAQLKLALEGGTRV